MNKYLFYISFCFLTLIVLLSTPSCTHDSLIPDDPGMPIDTSENTIPCDPDTIYFSAQILPILQSNCAFSGCHNAASAQDGVILDSYENTILTGEVVAFDLGESELYEVLIENDLEDRMPPPPASALNNDQIELIAEWILQGAKDLDCEEDSMACESNNVSFSLIVSPILNTYCIGCHSGGSPSGGISLDGHSNVISSVNNGSLLGSIKWQGGFENMPQNGEKLDDCNIEKIESWINDGAPNN